MGSARAVVVSLTCCCAMLVCFVMLLCILPAPVAAGKKAKEDDGPRLEVLSRSLPREVAPGVPIVVHARIDPGKEDGPDRSSFTGAHRVRGIALIYRFGFNAETRVEMRDDGVSPDQYADDGVYVSVIRTGDQGWPGGMVRWRAEATLATEPSGGGTANNNKRVLQAPPFTGAKSARYFGTVLGGRNHSTDLDVMHVFARDEKAMTTDEGTPVSLAFLGRFYDNVRVRRRGSGRGEKVVGVTLPPKDWPKHKLKFDFKGNVFHWSEDGDVAPVEEFNLQSHYQEPGEETYMRENLAAAVFAEAGVPAPAVFHVQVRLNGRYHGLFSFVEQVDAAFLKRWRLDPKGDMYKAVHWKYSNLRSPDIKAKCPWATPDWPNLWAERDGYCPEVWRVKGKGAAAKALDEAEKLEEKVKAGALRGDAANAKIEALRDASMAPMRELTKTLERAAAWGAAANAGKVAADGKDDVGARLLLDVLDIPAVINEMAAQTLVLSVDRCTKNYYMVGGMILQHFSFSKFMKHLRSVNPWDPTDCIAIAIPSSGAGYHGTWKTHSQWTTATASEPATLPCNARRTRRSTVCSRAKSSTRYFSVTATIHRTSSSATSPGTRARARTTSWWTRCWRAHSLDPCI